MNKMDVNALPNICSGIYQITCLGNNKIYIGSSKNIRLRLQTHIRTLNNNLHRNPHLQNAYSLFGNDFFRYTILEICSENKLKEREQYWMDITQCYKREFGFNNCTKADRPEGYKHTEETKHKMSLLKKEAFKQGTISCNWKYSTNKAHTKLTKEKIRLTKIGFKNPMWGYKEDSEKTKVRMSNMLSKPRWNKGLTKETDSRIAKLGVNRIGVIPYNAIKVTLIDLDSGKTWVANSIVELATKCPLSAVTLRRMRRKVCGKDILLKYNIHEN